MYLYKVHTLPYDLIFNISQNNINVELSFQFKSSAYMGSYINNNNYPKLQYSLILVIRPNYGASLQLYADVGIKRNGIVCYLHRIVDDQFVIGTLHLGLGLCYTIAQMLGGAEHSTAPTHF